MGLRKKSCTVFILAALVAAPGAAWATNGYFAHGYGTNTLTMDQTELEISYSRKF